MEKIIIYGAGNMGRAVCELLKGCCAINGFIDGNLQMKGTCVMGFPVYHPSELADKQELLYSTALVAMTVCPFSVMKQTLNGLGFMRVLPAGDYVANQYKEFSILNTWKCSMVGCDIAFADEKSDLDYQAACEWFLNRTDKESTLTPNKYFPDFLKPEFPKCKVMLDTGVLDGGYIDTFLQFSPGASVYAYTLTPPSVSIAQLQERFKNARVQLSAKEAAEQDGSMVYQRIGLMQPFTQKKSYCVQTEKIDTAMKNIPFDFLRCYSMSEVLPVLKGAQESIQKYRPIIAANIGHYQSDFISVPSYLNEVCLNYTFYFRMHSYQGNDCILYAVPKNEE